MACDKVLSIRFISILFWEDFFLICGLVSVLNTGLDKSLDCAYLEPQWSGSKRPLPLHFEKSKNKDDWHINDKTTDNPPSYLTTSAYL